LHPHHPLHPLPSPLHHTRWQGRTSRSNQPRTGRATRTLRAPSPQPASRA